MVLMGTLAPAFPSLPLFLFQPQGSPHVYFIPVKQVPELLGASQANPFAGLTQFSGAGWLAVRVAKEFLEQLTAPPSLASCGTKQVH